MSSPSPTPDGNTTTYDYNPQGQLIRMTDPLGHSATYAYNAAGLLSSTTDRDGRRRDFFYNAAGQITAENWYDATGNLVDELRFGYDSAGRLVSASSDEGALHLHLQRGRPARPRDRAVRALAGLQLRHGGRPDRRPGLLRRQYRSLPTTPRGQLISRQLAAPGQVTIGVSLDYTPDGEVNTLTRSAAGSTVSSTDYSYDDSGDVTGIAHLDASGNVLDGFVYAYDAAGQVTSESDFGATENPMGPDKLARPHALRDRRRHPRRPGWRAIRPPPARRSGSRVGRRGRPRPASGGVAPSLPA